MASSGKTVLGTDGADFQHRETIAGHYHQRYEIDGDVVKYKWIPILSENFFGVKFMALLINHSALTKIQFM